MLQALETHPTLLAQRDTISGAMSVHDDLTVALSTAIAKDPITAWGSRPIVIDPSIVLPSTPTPTPTPTTPARTHHGLASSIQIWTDIHIYITNTTQVYHDNIMATGDATLIASHISHTAAMDTYDRSRGSSTRDTLRTEAITQMGAMMTTTHMHVTNIIITSIMLSTPTNMSYVTTVLRDSLADDVSTQVLSQGRTISTYTSNILSTYIGASPTPEIDATYRGDTPIEIDMPDRVPLEHARADDVRRLLHVLRTLDPEFYMLPAYHGLGLSQYLCLVDLGDTDTIVSSHTELLHALS